MLSARVTDYTYVDFCAGAGGPTPFIERTLNASLECSNGVEGEDGSSTAIVNSGKVTGSGDGETALEKSSGRSNAAVKFILTDISPHIPDWTEAAKKSKNLTFIPKSVDAANAPADLVNGNGKVFRLFNLAFHHFDDKLGGDILKNTSDTSDGFGFVILFLL